MRTLKKVLALSLALAMIFSLTAVASEYKDADKINPDLVADIDLLNALGIMTGDDGNFNPTANVTRAEACKMMYVLKTNNTDKPTSFIGGTEAKKLYDIKGHWAESYVSYCAEMGIVSGQGKGKFNPNGNITGQELAKMLLVTVGYKSDVSGFTGASWATKVTMIASDVGMLDDYNLAYSMPATREYAAKLFSTTITSVPMVKYSKNSESYEDVTIGTVGKIQTVGNKTFGLVDTYARVESTINVSYSGANNASGINKVSVVKAYGDDDNAVPTGSTTNVKYAISDNLLGARVRIVSKGDLDSKAKVYGVYADSKIVNTTVDNVSVGTTDKTNKVVEVKVDGTGATYRTAGNAGGADTIDVYTNGTKAVLNLDASATGFDVNANNTVKMIDNDSDGKFDVAIINTVGYAKVASINATAKTATFTAEGATAPFAKNSFNKDNWDSLKYEGELAVGDYVSVARDLSTGKLVYKLTKLTAVEGTVGTFSVNKLNNVSKVNFAGADYYALATMFATGSGAADKTYLNGMDYKVLFVDGSYIVATGASTSSAYVPTNLAYVIAANAVLKQNELGTGTVYDIKVQLLKSDGTQGIYVYSVPSNNPAGAIPARSADGTTSVWEGTVDTAKGDPGDYAAAGTIVEYVMNGEKIYFKDLGAPAAGAAPAEIGSSKTYLGTATETFNATPASAVYSRFTKDTQRFTNNKGSYLTNDQSYFFVKSLDKNGDTQYTVMKASEFKANQSYKLASGTAANPFAYSTANGLPSLIFAVLDMGGAPVNGGTTTAYAFVTGSSTSAQNAKGDKWIVKLPINEKGIARELTFEVPVGGGAPAEIRKINLLDGMLITYTEVDGIAGLVGTTTNPIHANIGNVNSDSADTWNRGTVEAFENGTAYIKGTASDYYVVDKDTKIFNIDNSDGAVLVEGTNIVKSLEGATNTVFMYKTNIKTGVNVLTAIYVEINGGDIKDITDYSAMSIGLKTAYVDDATKAKTGVQVTVTKGNEPTELTGLTVAATISKNGAAATTLALTDTDHTIANTMVLATQDMTLTWATPTAEAVTGADATYVVTINLMQGTTVVDSYTVTAFTVAKATV